VDVLGIQDFFASSIVSTATIISLLQEILAAIGTPTAVRNVVLYDQTGTDPLPATVAAGLKVTPELPAPLDVIVNNGTENPVLSKIINTETEQVPVLVKNTTTQQVPVSVQNTPLSVEVSNTPLDVLVKNTEEEPVQVFVNNMSINVAVDNTPLDVVVTNDVTVNGAVAVTGDVVVSGAVAVTGDVAVTGAVAVVGAVAVSSVSGVVNVQGDPLLQEPVHIQGTVELVGYPTSGLPVDITTSITLNTDVTNTVDVAGAVEITNSSPIDVTLVDSSVVVSGTVDVHNYLLDSFTNTWSSQLGKIANTVSLVAEGDFAYANHEGVVALSAVGAFDSQVFDPPKSQFGIDTLWRHDAMDFKSYQVGVEVVNASLSRDQ